MKKLLLFLLLPVFCEAQSSAKRFDTMLIVYERQFEDSLTYIDQLRRERDYWKELCINMYLKKSDDLPDSVGLINDSTVARFYFFKSSDHVIDPPKDTSSRGFLLCTYINDKKQRPQFVAAQEVRNKNSTYYINPFSKKKITGIKALSFSTGE